MGIRYLCLNTIRTLWKKKIQLACIGIIIFLSSFLYTTMFYTMDSIQLSVEKLFEAANQEDFSIEVINGLLPGELIALDKEKQLLYSTYKLTDLKRIDYKLYEGILKRRIKQFEKIYPETYLEVRAYKDIDFTYNGAAHTIRIFKNATDMNKTYLEAGRMPSTSNEMAINRVYAEKNNIPLGGSITLGGKTYTVTGYVLFADMNLPMLGSEFIIDSGKITLGTMKDSAYERLQSEEHFYLAGKTTNKQLMEDFKIKIEDDYKNHDTLKFITGITATKNQMRSGMIYEELKMGKAATLGISIVIASIAVMIVGILVSKILKNEKVQIGVLKALGYSTTEVTLPYILMLLVIGLPMLVLGYIGGVLSAEPMQHFYLEFYLLPKGPIYTHVGVFATAVLVPLFFILALSFGMIHKMLAKDTIHLLKTGEKEKMTKLGAWISKLLSRTSAKTKFKYTFIFKNTGKFLVFFWGIMFSTMLILLSFMMTDFFSKMTTDYYESVDYIYEGYLDLAKPKPKIRADEEKFLSAPNVFYKEELVTVKGLEKNNKLHELHNKKGEILTSLLGEGFVVNQSFAVKYNVAVGDLVTLQIEDRAFERKVMGISKDYGDETVYCHIEDLSKMLTEGRSKKLFTGVYSREPLDEKMYMTVVDKRVIMEQTAMMQGFIQVAMYGMIGSAIFMSVLILYVLTTLTVEDNYYNISLLKVMGYNTREVNHMILNSYLVYAALTYILSVPITWLGIKVMVKYFSSSFDMVMPLEMEFWHTIAGFIMVIIIFLMGTYAAKRHIQKVSLQEVLKAYRE